MKCIKNKGSFTKQMNFLLTSQYVTFVVIRTSTLSEEIRAFKSTIPAENIFFIICFYAIMHRNIVQNKIISIICSCLFCPANIYRPSLWKVRLGRPTQNRFSHLIFISEEKEKTHSTQNCMHNNRLKIDFQFSFFLIFKKTYQKTCQNFELYIIISNQFFWGKINLQYRVVMSLLLSTQFISPHYDG